MATPEDFDAASIADQLAAAKKDGESVPAEPIESKPKAVIEDTGNDREPSNELPDRDNIIVRRKHHGSEDNEDSSSDATSSSSDGGGREDEDPEDLAGSEGTGNEDSESSDDTDGEVQEDGRRGGSENFRKLRKSQKEYKRRTEKLEEEVERLRPLKKYRDLVDLSLSPEFHDAYAGAREKMVEQADDIAELYDLDVGEVRTVFEQGNIRDAKNLLEDIVQDGHAETELGSVVRDFFINKSKEDKELKSSDPKERFEQLKEERESRLALLRQQQLEKVQVTKNNTVEDISGILEDPKQSEQLWPGVFDKNLKKYIQTDLPAKFTDETHKTYGAMYDALVKKGADLNHADSRKIAMMTADASMGIMANSIIGVLLDTLGTYEKELKKQTSNGNPRIRESSKVSKDNSDDGTPLTKEDKMLDLVKNLTAGS